MAIKVVAPATLRPSTAMVVLAWDVLRHGEQSCGGSARALAELVLKASEASLPDHGEGF